MKSFRLLLTIFCCLIIQISLSQTRRVVNNNPGAPGGTNVYTSFAAALSDAVAGDIIYLVPSSISYGTIDISKGVTVFGAGLIPDKDLGIKTHVDYVYIDASNVRVSGLIANNTIRLGQNISSTTISNITIENCQVEGIRHYTSNVTIGNLLIRNNVIRHSSYPVSLITTSSVIVTNNLIMVDRYDYNGINANGVTFSHNIFRYEGTNGNDGMVLDDVDNCLFEYNIFYGARPVLSSNRINNNFEYNVVYGTSNNSIVGIGTYGNTETGTLTTDPMFVNLSLGYGYSDSYDYTLDTGSSGIDINSTEDAGVHGGATPWDPDGSLLPTIQSITMPSVIPVGSDLDVNVTGKGN